MLHAGSLSARASLTALLFVAISATNLVAAVIAGTVKDASGGSTPRAHIEILGGDLVAPLAFETDALGRFASPDLKPGSYTLKVTADGFAPNIQTIEVSTANPTVVISLQVATLRQEVTVEGKVSALANNDPVYRQLRDLGAGATFQVHDLDLKFDVASFHLGRALSLFSAQSMAKWWGHTVGWASYHDQWLSEGFAEFSAGLFLQLAVGPKWQKDYIEFWERLRKEILEKNQFGAAPNDAGPLWLGLRLMSPRSENAYRNITYPKGAFVLAMLRSFFYSNKDQDKAFIEMMHDFVDTHRDRPASTESFKAIAEKHMPHGIDLENNRRLDWFFRQWVYGTEVPHYEFEYQISPGSDGKTKVYLSITQSQVSDNFAMFVPIFADFGKGFVRLGQLPVVGNATKRYDFDFAEAPKKVELNTFKEILVR